jgi:mRNA-degrading endonuclease RelE of RelBE toxin-antitoxin system
VAKLRVLLSPRFLATLKRLSETDVNRTEEALRVLPDCFGLPHRHAGISIRRLRKNMYECRAGLKVRILFRVHAQALEVLFAGNHDEVRRFVRNL